MRWLRKTEERQTNKSTCTLTLTMKETEVYERINMSIQEVSRIIKTTAQRTVCVCVMSKSHSDIENWRYVCGAKNKSTI